MRIQRVLLGVISIDRLPAIELFADLAESEIREQSAVMKDRLAYLLDTRFQPSEPILSQNPGLTVEDVANELHCRCRTVLQMVKRGDLHPLMVDNEPYFDPKEIRSVRYVPFGGKVVKLIRR